MGLHFVPDSFKVFLMVDLQEAGNRVYHDSLRKAETYQDADAAIKALYERQSLEKERYRELYGVNYYDLNHYNLVIDSTHASPAVIAEEIIKRFEQFCAGDMTRYVEISPYRIYPTIEMDKLDDLKVEKYSSDCEDKVCFDDVLEVVLKDGNWYASGENEKLLAAQVDKKLFVCTEQVHKDVQSSEKICKEYEERAEFQYLSYPEEKKKYSNEKMYE